MTWLYALATGAMLLAFLALPLATAATTVWYVAPSGSGSDSSTGTAAQPLATLQQCVSRLHAPGDECRLLGGRHRFDDTVVVRGKFGTPEQPIVIAAALGADVTIDGTFTIPNDAWRKETGPFGCGGVYSAATTPTWQLFADGEMQTVARWPDAFWFDKTIFLGPEQWGTSVMLG